MTAEVVDIAGQPLYFELDGEGEAVMLLHGFSGSGRDWAVVRDAWAKEFRVIVPDLRGHGRSGSLRVPFRHRDAAADIRGLLDYLGIMSYAGVGISGGGNVLLHLATGEPERVRSMVLVSATPYFPQQARDIMQDYGRDIPPAQWDYWRRSHPGGDAQIEALLESARKFAESYDDLTFTPPELATIQARTLIIQGDRDPLYPVELSVEMARAIPKSSLWIVPGSGHGPVFGERWEEFLGYALKFLRNFR